MSLAVGRLWQRVEVEDPLALAAAAENAQTVLDISGRGIKLAGGDGSHVRLVFFVPEQIVI